MHQELRRKPRNARSLSGCLLCIWTLSLCAIGRAQEYRPPPPAPSPSGAESGLPAAAAAERPRSLEEAVRLTLVQATSDAYYGLALATARRRAAEESLSAAEEFERATSLLAEAGEVAPIDLGRAQLQTLTRRDELEQARTNETVAAGALRVLVA